MYVAGEGARGCFGGCGRREGAREIDAAVGAPAAVCEIETGAEVAQGEEDGVFVERAGVDGGVRGEGSGGGVREEGREVGVRFWRGGNDAARSWEVMPAGRRPEVVFRERTWLSLEEDPAPAGTERTGMWVRGHRKSVMAEEVVTREHLDGASQRWWRWHYGILTR